MAHIFISYSKQDIAFARHLRAQLQQAGCAVWMDEQQLVPSERWWPTIEDNIETCAAFVVIMSPAARESDWVEREILYAEQLGRPIFPVLLAGPAWPRLANIQYADMRAGVNATIPDRLKKSLQAVCGARTARPPAAARPKSAGQPRGCMRRLVMALIVVVLLGGGALVALAALGDTGLGDWVDDLFGGASGSDPSVQIIVPPRDAEFPTHSEPVVEIRLDHLDQDGRIVLRFDEQVRAERPVSRTTEFVEVPVLLAADPGPHTLFVQLFGADDALLDQDEVMIHLFAP